VRGGEVGVQKAIQGLHLGCKNCVYILHGGMCDVQAALAHGCCVGVVQTQQRVAVGLQRCQCTHGVVTASRVRANDAACDAARRDARLDDDVAVGEWPHCDVEYRQAAPFVLCCLGAIFVLQSDELSRAEHRRKVERCGSTST
jgi:hypothetical protein